jgi:hypothetical protein
MIATGVPSPYIELAWPYLWPFMQRALVHSDEKTEAATILAGIRENRFQGWLVYDKDVAVAGICTELLRDTTSGHLECLLWLIGGARLSSWAPDFLSKLILWAKSEGCTSLSAGGRRGWGRWAERYGFEATVPRNGRPHWVRPL